MDAGRETRALRSVAAWVARCTGELVADEAMLRQALTHASIEGTAAKGGGTYERLEFLGDRVLGLAVADWLYRRWPDETEGDLARRHAALVAKDALAKAARTAGLGDALLLAKSEADSGGRENDGILADALEAVLGAVYVTSGFTSAVTLAQAALAPALEAQDAPPQDPRSALQEWAQGRGLPLPAYETVASEGPAHAPTFTVRVLVQGQDPVEAVAGSKRGAMRDAAERLLAKLDHTA